MTVGTAFILGYFVGAICFFVSWCIAKKSLASWKSKIKKSVILLLRRKLK